MPNCNTYLHIADSRINTIGFPFETGATSLYFPSQGPCTILIAVLLRYINAKCFGGSWSGLRSCGACPVVACIACPVQSACQHSLVGAPAVLTRPSLHPCAALDIQSARRRCCYLFQPYRGLIDIKLSSLHGSRGGKSTCYNSTTRPA